ncbi:hypothetical protein [Brevibacillus aydinogluensis]|jgi:hypothetical protein|uniref:Uncharacterized protein n=1 Tax=Brevibacillus aydinogluensis TaxID=927786 RepID=A0AA48M6N9_9BACL|nr:hypothetical protein [Brevibacillus aydinogluensis]CAJ1002233.1 hypothetical protein BSPP4475_07900 [Brevibacillus aydinogluensis]
MLKRSLSVLLSATIFVTALAIPAAASASPSNTAATSQSSIASQIEQKAIEPQWKGKVTRKTLLAAARKLENRNSVIYDIVEYFTDKDTVDAFYKNIDPVAKKLREMAEFTEVAEKWVEDQLTGALHASGVPYSISRHIAYAVCQVLL